jgi:hypothetical protein
MDLSYLIVELKCPSCDFLLEVLIKQVTSEETILCTGCLLEIKLVDEGKSVQSEQRDLDEALDNFSRNTHKYWRQ